MSCPKCGHALVDAPECPRCGVIYAKARQRAPALPPQESPALAGAAAPRGSRRALVMGVAVVAAACAIAALAIANRRAAVEPSPLAGASGGAAQADDAPEEIAEGPGAAAAAEGGADEPSPGEAAVASGGEPAPVPAAEPPAPEPASCGIYSLDDVPGAPPAPRVSGTWYEGASGFRSAEEEHGSSGAPLLALFYVDWCPHCTRFIAEVVPSAEMRELGERIVKVRIDAEGSEDDRALARRFAVKSYPTLLLFAAPGRPPERIRSWSTPGAFVESCERALPNPSRERLGRGIALARAGAGQASAAAAELKAAAAHPALATLALDHLGLAALGASCFERAVVIFTRVLELDSTYERGRAHHLRGFAHLRSGDAPRALEDAERACRLGYEQACPIAEKLGRAVAAGR